MSGYDFLTGDTSIGDTPITDPNQLIQDNSKILDRMSQRRQLLQDEEHKQPLLSDLKTYLLLCDITLLKHIYTCVTRRNSTDDEREMDIINHMLWYFSDKTLEQTKKIIEDIYTVTKPLDSPAPDSSDDDPQPSVPYHDWKKYSEPVWSMDDSMNVVLRLNLIQQIIKTLPNLTTEKLQAVYDSMA